MGIAWQHVAEIPETATQTWLVDGVVPVGGGVILGGEAKIGKSWLAIDLAVSVASGTPWLGKPVAQRAVLYVVAEGAAGWRDRVAGIARAKGLSLGDLELASASGGFDLMKAADRARLRTAVEEIGAGLVVLDPLSLLHTGDEDRASDMNVVLGGLRKVIAPGPTTGGLGASALVVHHMRKPREGGSSGRLAHRLRGSGAVHAWADALLYLRRIRGGLLRLDAETRDAAEPAPLVVTRAAVEGGGWRHTAEAAIAQEPRPAKVPVDYVARVLAEMQKAPAPPTEIARRCGKKGPALAAIRAVLADGRAATRPDGFVAVVGAA